MKRPSFESVMDELNALRIKKGADYGTDEDPLANIKSSEMFGIPPWVNAILRANDKVYRIQTFVKRNKLKNESVEDALIDLAVYAIHAIRLYREKYKSKTKIKKSKRK